VTIVDNDETIIPRISEGYFNIEDYNNFLLNTNFDRDFDQIEAQLDKIKCSSPEGQSPLDSYMSRIKSARSISYYFQQGFYLNDQIFDRLFQLLDERLGSTIKSGELFSKPFELNLAYEDAQNEQMSFNYTFSVTNAEDHLYARNLIKLDRNFVRPFREKNRVRLGQVSENYGRFYALMSVKDNEFTSGKSIHTTNHTRNVCVHSLCGMRDRLVTQQLGHLSHFRRFFKFRKFILFNIRQIVFDLNYFNCFVRPTLNRLDN
jgi:hypothetical protein